MNLLIWCVSMIDENVCWVWNVMIIEEEGISWCGDMSYYTVIYYGVLGNTSVMLGYVLCCIKIIICISCLYCVNDILHIFYCNLWWYVCKGCVKYTVWRRIENMANIISTGGGGAWRLRWI